MPKATIAFLIALLAASAAAGGGYLLWQKRADRLPDGIVWSNGRIEADDIDITPKFAGRVGELLVDEGDMVKAGQVVARMDTRDLEAMLRKAEAQVLQASKGLDEAKANRDQQRTRVRLADQELGRARFLVQKGVTSKELLDQRQQEMSAANAALVAADAKVGEVEHALDAADHDVELAKVNIADGVLVAPRDARVQYRLVNTGEVVGAGAKIFTLLDVSSVYMTIFLPTEEAGKVAIGAEGRIVVDAYPKFVIPGKVTFVAAKSQFTPKTVETRAERDRLMFRIKVHIDAGILARHAADVRTGLPGVAYVRVDPAVQWPERLRANVPL
ncbi:MAG TPA: HlyD family efflux transporter periplasmic adaptor subunit [Candidatus Cybelea sp.]|nr:HlyD family efflux transporter periplasmic adaptor subunit [Candidatus Cybelea sp.]